MLPQIGCLPDAPQEETDTFDDDLNAAEFDEAIATQKEAMSSLSASLSFVAQCLKPKEEAPVEAQELPTDLNYQETWPTVEITVSVIEVMSFDLVGMCFDVEFLVDLDWKDDKLRRGIHYDFNAERGKFEIMQALQNCKNDIHVFNPKLVVLNSKTEPVEEISIPEILDELAEEKEGESVEIPWLHKKFRFIGTCSCRNVNACYFPFDINILRIRLACQDMRSCTTRPRRITFTEPKLRSDWRMKKKKAGRSLTGFAVSRQTDGIMSHMWRMDSSGGNTLEVGEMKLVGMGGVVDDDGHGVTGYSLAMAFRRNWNPRYAFDIAIYNLQTASAIASLWAPFDGDMLANRMSITLTVLLAVVGVSCVRPPVIENLPYSTLHDVYGQCMVFSVLLIGCANWFLYYNCWGMYRTQGEDDVYNKNTTLTDSYYRKGALLPEWWCKEEGSGFMDCGASRMDCCVLYFTVCSLLTGLAYAFVSSQMYRVETLLRLKHRLDSQIDDDGQKYSNFIASNTEGSGFDLVEKYDMLSFGRLVAIIPGFKCFMRIWRCMRKCSECCFPRALRKQIQDALDIGGEEDIFHPLDAGDLLFKAIDSMAEKKQKLPSISRFPVKLTPYDTFRVLDVGSGEMGFYSYWLDMNTREVKAGGTEGKLKYKDGLTFVDQFLDDKMGAESLSQEMIERLKLVPRINPLKSLDGDIPNPKKNSSKVLMSLTGANRQMLVDAAEGRAKLDAYVQDLNTKLEAYELEVIVYSPEDTDEAMYELCATEWVVQTGDLEVKSTRPDSKSITLQKAYRVLQKGRDEHPTTWKEVSDTFSDLNAEGDLRDAYRRAAGRLQRDDDEELPETVGCGKFYRAFEASEPLLRALVRSRLFSGTLSAGSGSSQVTFRTASSLGAQQVNSLPMGNRTPLVSMKLNTADGSDVSSVLSKRLHRTRELALKLLCEESGIQRTVSNLAGPAVSADKKVNEIEETRPAWGNDGPVDPEKLKLWRDLVTTCAEERELPTSSRGLFVGISAIFYAAKAAKCEGQILQRDEFLDRLQVKINGLMDAGGKGSGRDLANLTLVSALVEFTLHRSASIVCKRNWKVGEDGHEKVDFVATWTLGMYLKHSGVMGEALHMGHSGSISMGRTASATP